MDYIKQNEEAWNQHVEKGYVWSVPVSHEVIEAARRGEWDLVVTPDKPIPRSWYPDTFEGNKILLIAGGGGQQGPILAALGADVTVFDNSPRQLEMDRMVAEREGLTIHTVQGNMQDLSVFTDETFDFILQFGGVFVDDVLPVWKEAYRVLRHGGVMVAGHNNPNDFIFDLEKMEQGEFVVRHTIPYSDLTALEPDEFARITADEGVCFGHSLEDLIQGQIDAGFVITGFYEDAGHSLLSQYIPIFFATKAKKM